MYLSPRHSEIIKIAKENGRVLVDDLAAHFSVTPQTIRKELNDLCEQRLLTRIHGGAVFPSGIEDMEYEARHKIAADEKEAIGRAAAGLIPDNASLFINIANRMRIYPSFEVVIAGGVVRGSDGGVVGEAAVDFINQSRWTMPSSARRLSTMTGRCSISTSAR